jgi:hypothetical protein
LTTINLSLEEDEDDVGDDYEEEPLNPLVEALFDEIDNLRSRVRSFSFFLVSGCTLKIIQLFHAEERSVLMEADIREEVMREMEERMQAMEKLYARRLINEVNNLTFSNTGLLKCSIRRLSNKNRRWMPRSICFTARGCSVELMALNPSVETRRSQLR